MAWSEHRAALLLLGLAVVGHGARLLLGRPGEPGGAVTLLSEREASPAAHRDSAVAALRPRGADERIDVDRATARELARLPGIGPALARAIEEDRRARGPFGSLEGLDRVRGVGPGLLGRLGPHLAFSAPPSGAGARPGSPPDGDGLLVDLNSADAAALATLPGIGPARARAILAHRAAHGPFGSLEALGAVPGIGPSVLGRLRGRVRLGGRLP